MSPHGGRRRIGSSAGGERICGWGTDRWRLSASSEGSRQTGSRFRTSDPLAFVSRVADFPIRQTGELRPGFRGDPVVAGRGSSEQCGVRYRPTICVRVEDKRRDASSRKSTVDAVPLRNARLPPSCPRRRRSTHSTPVISDHRVRSDRSTAQLGAQSKLTTCVSPGCRADPPFMATLAALSVVTGQFVDRGRTAHLPGDKSHSAI